jgi:hypothetical protein
LLSLPTWGLMRMIQPDVYISQQNVAGRHGHRAS